MVKTIIMINYAMIRSCGHPALVVWPSSCAITARCLTLTTSSHSCRLRTRASWGIWHWCKWTQVTLLPSFFLIKGSGYMKSQIEPSLFKTVARPLLHVFSLSLAPASVMSSSSLSSDTSSLDRICSSELSSGPAKYLSALSIFLSLYIQSLSH